MKSVAELTGPQTVVLAKERFEVTQTEAEFYIDGGEFLPLGVWGARGYDIEAIKSKTLAADIREHPVLGTTYRVKILSTGNRGERGKKRSSILDAKGTLQKSTNEETTVLALEDGAANEAASDSSSSKSSASSSSSSSSSSSRRKSKKGKKSKKNKRKKDKKEKKVKKAKKVKKKKDETPAERKEREKQERIASKAAAKVLLDRKKFAETIISKINAPMLSLQTQLDKKDMHHVPDVVATPAQETMVRLKHMQEVATDVIKSEGQLELPCSDLKDINTLIGEAKRSTLLVSQMMATIAKV